MTINDYSPHKEWLLACAYMTATNVDDELERFYWDVATPKDLRLYEIPIEGMRRLIKAADFQVAEIMYDQYLISTEMAQRIETGVLHQFRTMAEYYNEITALVARYAKAGFYDHFDDSKACGKEAAWLMFRSTDASDQQFALLAALDWFTINEMKLPKMLEFFNDFAYEPKHIRSFIIGAICDYFYVGSKRPWQGNDPRAVHHNNVSQQDPGQCPHSGSMLWSNEHQTYFCGWCDEPIPTEMLGWGDGLFSC